jgi:zinc transporter 1/2/3
MVCDDNPANLTATIECLEGQLELLQDSTMTSTSLSSDPCASELSGEYNTPLHVGAVFIILFVSLAGVFATLLGKYVRRLQLSTLTLCLGKTAGTGILICTALVHMLLPSNASLTSPCVPAAFSEDYEAYAYLFALLAALAMQSLETLVARAVRGAPRGASPAALHAPAAGCHTPDCPAESIAVDPMHANAIGGGSSESSGGGLGGHPPPAYAHSHSHSHSHGHGGGGGGSQSSPLLSALFAEFGYTVHSIFIGLAVGVVNRDELPPLLIALCFHQFFEGVSLGARLFDAPLSAAVDVLLAIVYAISAPIGIGIGLGLTSSGDLGVNDASFLLVQGTFDGICAGILLYIGFCMLINDFPTDLARVSGETVRPAREAGSDGDGGGALKLVPATPPKYVGLRQLAMFVALWGGAGSMAFIGRYL